MIAVLPVIKIGRAAGLLAAMAPVPFEFTDAVHLRLWESDWAPFWFGLSLYVVAVSVFAYFIFSFATRFVLSLFGTRSAAKAAKALKGAS
jgi:hypothetical protein